MPGSQHSCHVDGNAKLYRYKCVPRGERKCYYGNTSEHWASIPKVVGSIPTVARHIFQACPVWIYTQSNITSIKWKGYIISPMS